MGDLNFAELLLLLVAVQQLLAAAIWLLAVRLRVAPRVPSLHWVAASVWAAVCAAVVSPLNVPTPLWVMPTVCVALPVNVSAVGAATIVGGVVTVKVTGTSRDVLVAPGAAMRTLAV